MIARDRAATTTSLDVASAFQHAGTRNRLAVVDLGRGAVMALMALDHPRTFLTSVAYSPSDVSRTLRSE